MERTVTPLNGETFSEIGVLHFNSHLNAVLSHSNFNFTYLCVCRKAFVAVDVQIMLFAYDRIETAFHHKSNNLM